MTVALAAGVDHAVEMPSEVMLAKRGQRQRGAAGAGTRADEAHGWLLFTGISLSCQVARSAALLARDQGRGT